MKRAGALRFELPKTFAWLAPVLVFAACDDFPPKGWFVDRTRVLGARVEAEAEPARASLAPNERGTIGWLVATPVGTPPPRFGWSFATCPRPAGNYADPRCEGGALSTATGIATSAGELVPTPLTIPATDADELLVIAAFCADAAPALEPRTFEASCTNGQKPLLASTLVELRTPNKNPLVADDAVRVDGVVVPPAPAGTPCAALTPVRGLEHTLFFRFAEAQREQGETLTVSQFVNGGDLERQYSVLEKGAAPNDVDVRWNAPAATAAGVPVDVHFVLRDGRGGLAFARRTVCALP